MCRLKGGEEVGQEDVYEISGVIPDRWGHTWHLAPGTWYLALGTWHLAPVHQAPGTWHLAT